MRIWPALFLAILLGGGLQAQPTPSPTSVVVPEQPPPLPTPYALTDITTSLESSRDNLKEIEADLSQAATPSDIETGIDAVTKQVRQLQPMVRLTLAQEPSAAKLKEMESTWKDLGSPLVDWKKRLTARASELDSNRDTLKKLRETWAVAEQSELPPKLLEEQQKLVQRMDAALDKIRQDRDQLLLMLDHLNTVSTEIKSTLAELSAARQELVKQLLTQDSRPIWKVDLGELSWKPLVSQTLDSLESQVKDLESYVAQHSDHFLLHLLSFGLLALGLNWAGKRVAPWVETEPELQRPVEVFCTPLATGLLLTYLLSPWFYPQPPLILQALLGAMALFPATLVLSRLIGPNYQTLLKLMVTLFLVDQIRELTSPQILLTRLLFTAEITLVLAFLAWRARYGPNDPTPARARSVAGLFYVVAWTTTNLGFVNLGNVVGQAALSSSYLAILLLALLQVVEGLGLLSLRTPPLSLLSSVQNYGELYRRRVRMVARWLAAILWFWSTLELLSLSKPFFAFWGSVLGASLHLGALSLSLGSILTLVLALSIPYQLSHLLRFQLEQDVYPRLGMSQGQTYTLSALVHYLILGVGCFVGLTAIGVDGTQFAIVAGALSVGIGFGLQNIVNNFVSGLILLFERPIEVGHVIEVAGQAGSLQKIGLRASVLRTPDGSEIIVPNGELLSTKVTNWTLSDQRRLLRMDFGVAYGTSPARVKQLLLEVALHHVDVSKQPPPEVLLMELGESSINFQLRVWTDNSSRWPVIRSDLLISAYEALNEAGISIPFPQRTVHMVDHE